MGGSTKKGIDCSGFVQRTFREQFGLELPRSTYEQQEMGNVFPQELRTGDLVCPCRFNGTPCGIYIGNNQFVHASTSSGVIISSMNEPYWKKRSTKHAGSQPQLINRLDAIAWLSERVN
ncbi:NlpC/P60 family protein [Escherichia coli]